MKETDMYLFIHGWPKKLQKRLRVAAAKAGRTLKSVITEACEQWLQRRGK